MKIYSVRDSKAKAYMRPFFVQSDEVAIRAIKQAMFDPESEFYRFAEDYSVWYIGEFDDKTGEITPAVPEVITQVLALKEDK
jgi:hypothetical protein